MSSSSHRREKLEELLRNEIARILERDFSVPGAMLTVLGVAVSPDGQHARVSVSVFPDNTRGGIMRRLETDVYEIQQELNKKLRMRPVPKIRFMPDESEETASRIDEILRRVQYEGLPAHVRIRGKKQHPAKTRRGVHKTARPH